MIYYLEVISNEVSFLAGNTDQNIHDSDVGYYQNLKSGSILEVEFDTNTIKLIRIDEYRFPVVNPAFYLNVEKVDSKRLTISSLISLRKMVDVTDSINRQKKLEQLGI
jgi:hypothetical protein